MCFLARIIDTWKWCDVIFFFSTKFVLFASAVSQFLRLPQFTDEWVIATSLSVNTSIAKKIYKLSRQTN